MNEKQKALDEGLWQVLFDSKENMSFWSTNTPIKNYPRELRIDTLPAIASLVALGNKIKKQDFKLPLTQKTQLETDLQKLSFDDGGDLIKRFVKINDC